MSNEYRPCICVDEKNTYVHGYIKITKIKENRKVSLKDGREIKIISAGIPVTFLEAAESDNILE